VAVHWLQKQDTVLPPLLQRNDTNWVLLGRRTVLRLRVSDREVGGDPSLWSDRGTLQLVFPEECVYGPDQWPLRLVDVTATKVAMR